MKTIFCEMIDRWGSPIVSRTEVKAFSGGLLNEKTMANSDSAGLGCPGRFRIGRKVVYPTKNLAEFLESRSEVIPERNNTGQTAGAVR